MCKLICSAGDFNKMEFDVIERRVGVGVFWTCCCTAFYLLGAASVYAAELENADWSKVIKEQKSYQDKLEKKAEKLVQQMTLDEKMSLYVMSSAEIERLEIPAHDWWNEAIHGVARNGEATQFPVSIAMASTWDPDLIIRMSDAIGKEARGIYNSRGNPTDRYAGLTIWSPTLNLARDPRWGRNEETYGEDPLLISEMGTSYILGLQGTDPNYYQAVACAKHFIANNSEYNRFYYSPEISERDLREHYMPAFRSAVEDANVQQFMTAYNGLNNVPCTVNRWLLNDVLRNEWGFSGTVVSDAGAPTYLISQHEYASNNTDAVAGMLHAGVDVVADFNDKIITGYFPEALSEGLVSEEMLDQSIVRNLTTRMQLGQIVEDSDNPYKKISESVVGSDEHLKIAREIAAKGAVLLKNNAVDGSPVFPLKSDDIKKIIVAGPYADVAQIGAYSGMSIHSSVTPFDGLREKAAQNVTVEVFPFYGINGRIIPSKNLLPPEGINAKFGLKAEYYADRDLQGDPVFERVDSTIDFSWRVAPLKFTDPDIPRPVFSTRWTGRLKPDESEKGSA